MKSRTPRRGRRVALAGLIAGALLLAPVAAFAQPAHAAEAGNAYARGHATAPGQIKKAPPVAADVTAPAIEILSVSTWALRAGQSDSATVVAKITDESGELGSVGLDVDAGGYSTPLADNGDGTWTGTVYVDPYTPLGLLGWRVVAADAAGNVSSVAGPTFTVL